MYKFYLFINLETKLFVDSAARRTDISDFLDVPTTGVILSVNADFWNNGVFFLIS